MNKLVLSINLGCTLFCMTIAVYLRVSSLDQDEASQKPDIEKWLISHGHTLDDVLWFVDHESGDKLARPELEALNKAVFNGEVKTLLVWKLDRIARSLQDGINTLSYWLDHHVRGVSVTQQIDLTGMVGKIVASVLFGVAEIELNNIRERQAAGIVLAKAKGVYKGRQKGSLKSQPCTRYAIA